MLSGTPSEAVRQRVKDGVQGMVARSRQAKEAWKRKLAQSQRAATLAKLATLEAKLFDAKSEIVALRRSV